ncbi:EVE domain-containing protein [Salinisphaera sp. Q1T1-3]|uniref:EVE domain-containing protein n=1 Tax=Salinisphaera sp. Q1T1-3 TaxID=2321229 RepID=UPI000E764C05|nr:EVE domain-containing protein [Salinisphaera sp. Q1T1-3]RJS94672.1 EVE domain-containing protein [Salinisphaera sp. Q1T1-3]
MRYWLMKSEPDEFSITDLQNRANQTEGWDGVRNYQARNFMRDGMSEGDLAFFYHSNTKVPGVVGIMRISREGYPDDTAFDPKDPHYDPKSDPDKPRWYRVDVTFERELARVIPLSEIKDHAEALDGLPLVRKGNRLSVMPIDKPHWDFILDMEHAETE